MCTAEIQVLLVEFVEINKFSDDLLKLNWFALLMNMQSLWPTVVIFEIYIAPDMDINISIMAFTQAMTVIL